MRTWIVAIGVLGCRTAAPGDAPVDGPLAHETVVAVWLDDVRSEAVPCVGSGTDEECCAALYVEAWLSGSEMERRLDEMFPDHDLVADLDEDAAFLFSFNAYCPEEGFELHVDDVQVVDGAIEVFETLVHPWDIGAKTDNRSINVTRIPRAAYTHVIPHLEQSDPF